MVFRSGYQLQVVCRRDLYWVRSCFLFMWMIYPIMSQHRENSPVTQTTPEPTLLSWGGWPREKRIRQSIQYTYTLNGIVLEAVANQKDLGVIVSDDLTPGAHISYITKQERRLKRRNTLGGLEIGIRCK